MMGDGRSGCHALMAAAVGWGQVSLEWMMVPGETAVSNTRSASAITRPCCATLCGCPSVCPKGNSTASVRGVPTFSAQYGIIVTKIVAKPASSSVRANTGTLMAQSGQAGVSSTQSTFSCLKRAATSGPYCSAHTVASGGNP